MSKLATILKPGTEHAHQVAFFAWCAIARRKGFAVANQWAAGRCDNVADQPDQPIDALEWIHAIPNGGSRGDSKKARMIRGAQLKAEGVREGVADIFLPFGILSTRGSFHGLYIELKRPELKPKRGGKGGLSDAQNAFADAMIVRNYDWQVCYGWAEAAVAVQGYLGVSDLNLALTYTPHA